MPKVDLKKELKHLYNPSAKHFAIVDVPPFNFLMIDGHGDPNSSSVYQEALEVLYAVSYGCKFALKREQGVDYSVMPLEGLWWAEDMGSFTAAAKEQWDWTIMILQPEWVTAELVERVQSEAARKKGSPAFEKLRFEPYHEGPAAQIMYIGAYADEGPTVARLHAFIAEQGYEPSGKHHEIYLGDPRRTAPEKLRTVIRQPIRKR